MLGAARALESTLEHLGGSTKIVLQKQRLPECEQQLHLVTCIEVRGADNAQHFAGGAQVSRVRTLAITLQMGARQHDAGGIRRLRRLSRRTRRRDRVVKLTLVVVRPRPGQIRHRGLSGAGHTETDDRGGDQRDACYFGVPSRHGAMVARSTMAGWMPEPVIIPRADHPISRRDIDPDALKVLYRLQQFNYTAYLVGGSVRDLLLRRRPKDFDVGTDAHPYQIKKLFRNCWIIGRRFRLAHVRFGNKAIEVATFRRHVLPGTENEPATAETIGEEASAELQIRHDNTFGTPEEDAFRRDFTINALFYDIATFSIIDYVGGLEDLRKGVVRSIGDPSQRFQEDPVRMFRAVAFAARLGFTLDPPVIDGIRQNRQLIANASPARLIEEYYKVLRSGAAERTFRLLAQHGLLETITPELHRGASEEALWLALGELDRYRQRFDAVPAGLTNAVLLGTLLVPLGLMPRRDLPHATAATRETEFEDAAILEDVEQETAETETARPARSRRGRRSVKEPPMRIGMLPVARRDTERLRQLLSVQRRLLDLESSPRAKRSLMHRGPFQEALVWLEIHGHVPEALEHWRGFIEALGGVPAHDTDTASQGEGTGVRRGRRRRGRRRGRRGFNRREP